MNTEPKHIELLRDTLAQRKVRNPKYSLRAFARSLDMDAAHLSKILAKKVRFPLSSAPTVIRLLEMDRDTASDFIFSVAAQYDNYLATYQQ